MLEHLKKLNPAILKYAIGAILLVIPIYPKFPLFSVPGTYVAIRIEDFLIATILLLWLVNFFASGRSISEFLQDRINRAILLFWAVGLLSVASSLFLTHTASASLALLHWARRVEYMSIFAVSVDAARGEKRPAFFVQILLIALLIVAFYGWGQINWRFPVISTQNEEYSKGVFLYWLPGSRLHSTFAGHYDLAAFLVMFFPIVVGYLFYLRTQVARILVFLFTILPGFWLFMATSSRISFASYLLAVPVTLWFLGRRKFIVPFLLASILGSFLLGDIGARYKFFIELYTRPAIRIIKQVLPTSYVWPPIADAQSEPTPTVPPVVIEDRSIEIRLNQEWPRALRAFYKNPLLGTGYSSITLATDNDFLRMLGETGVVGTLALLLVLARIFAKVFGFLKSPAQLSIQRVLTAGFLGGFAGLMLNATFIDVLEASKVAIIFWTLAGLAVGISLRGKNEA